MDLLTARVIRSSWRGTGRWRGSGTGGFKKGEFKLGDDTGLKLRRHMLLDAEHTGGADTKVWLDYDHYKRGQDAGCEGLQGGGFQLGGEKEGSAGWVVATCPAKPAGGGGGGD